MYGLGHIHESANEQKQAELWYHMAIAWFEKEIKKSLDNTEAMTGLAAMYENGKGTEKNIQQALQYYKQAAELGDEDAKMKVKELEK